MTKRQKTTLVRIGISALLLIALHFAPVDGWLRFALYLIPYLIMGAGVLKRAVEGVARREPFDENLLMAVATVGAMALGEYPEGVAVMLFYQIGELFEDYAVGKSRRNISDLMDIRPDHAILETPGGLQKVDPEDVAVGSTIVVKPGERVPLDGTVLEGSSALNMSALTGESVPRDVTVGDAVISGSVNLTGVLRLRADKVYGESTVARILELVENSSLKKAKTENFITKFARWYTPAVCISALVLAILPPAVRLLMGMDAAWSDWVYRALTFLVISCPCALVISIPLSFFGGIGGASARGILVKGSSYLEILSKTDRVVFDKTGTLTRGTFEVTDVRPEPSVTADELLKLAAAAERYSDHPVSLSLQKAAGELPENLTATDARELAGHGVVARIGGAKVAVGNGKLMQQLGLRVPDCDGAGTVVYVARDGQYAGHIVIADRPKPGAAKAVAALKACGVSRVVMLTGDRAQTANAVARELGIGEVYSELLPADKVTQVERLLAEGAQGRYLAFVGDGINDAPVLARADLGVAMGAIGSDAAIEAADLVLMDDDPEKLSLAMSIARKTMKIVWENIVFALMVKAACLILGALGIAGMWLAIFADVGVMVLCVLNAARALSTKRL